MTEAETKFREWLETQPQYRHLLKPTPTADVARSIIGAAGSAIGAGANAAAGNRGVQLEVDIARAQLQQQAERDYHDQLIRREQSGREGQRHSWDLMNRAAHVERATGKSPGFAGKYSRDIQAPSADQKRTADIARQEFQRQIVDGNQLPMPQRIGADVQVQPPGKMERIGGVAGPVASIVSRLPAGFWRKVGKWIS